MANIVCKSCGAVLGLAEGTEAFACSICGTEQKVQDAQADILRKGFLAAKSGSYAQAEASVNDALEQDPQCAEAYLLRALCQMRLSTSAQLGTTIKIIANNASLKTALELADGKLNVKRSAAERTLCHTQ